MHVFKEKMLSKLETFLDVNKLMFAENDGWSVVIDGKNNLSLYVHPGEIVLTFFTEHTHYYAFDYDKGDKWIDICCEELKFLLSHPIKYERVYHGKILTKTKLYSQGSDGEWKRYDGVIISGGILARMFNRKHIKPEIIEFKQQ